MPPPADADLTYLAYAVRILRALEGATDEDGKRVPGNRRRAAAVLGISARTLDEHIESLGLRELCRADGQSALWPLSRRQPRQSG
jgi:hypothetical protein